MTAAAIPYNTLDHWAFHELRAGLSLPKAINRNAAAGFLANESAIMLSWLREQLADARHVCLIIDNYYRTRRGVNMFGVMARWHEGVPDATALNRNSAGSAMHFWPLLATLSARAPTRSTSGR